MRTLFDRLKPKHKSQVIDFINEYQLLGESISNDLNKFFLLELSYRTVLELSRVCKIYTTNFIEIKNLFEEE